MKIVEIEPEKDKNQSAPQDTKKTDSYFAVASQFVSYRSYISKTLPEIF
jgi:hypothetical protein